MANNQTLWLESSDIVSMFPTFVWKNHLKLDAQKSVNSNILKAVGEMRRDSPTQTAGRVWQSTHELLKVDAFRELGLCINDAAKSVLTFLRISNEKLVITGCWVNVSEKGGSHGVHSHPNNFLSGVYYVQTQPGADTICFHDPRIQTGIIRPPVTELTAYNTDQVVVQVNSGTLILFPSYLQHSVSPNESDEERVSVSFNMMFSSFDQRMSKPLW